MSRSTAANECSYHHVAVAGGALRVARWGTGPIVAYGAHGLTSNHMSFAGVAAALGADFSLVVPDLRGRGGSCSIGGGGLDDHAADAIAVLDYFEVEHAMLVGHALGGFVAAAAAARHPDRFDTLILVDGGLPFGPAPACDAPIEDLAREGLAPILARLATVYEAADDYLDVWRRNPATGRYWNAIMEWTFHNDLVGAPGAFRPAVDEAVVVTDCVSQMTSCNHTAAGLSGALTLIRAGRNLLDRAPGMYTDAVLDEWRDRLPGLKIVTLEAANHLTVLLSEPGSYLIASVLQDGAAHA